MSTAKSNTLAIKTAAKLDENLQYLKLPFIKDNYEFLATQATKNKLSHVDYLSRLIEGEADRSQDRSIQRRIRQARFPVIKTLDQFEWTWPKKINRLQIQNVFRLKFIGNKANIILLGGVAGENTLGVCLGLCCMSARLFRSLHHCYRRNQYSFSR